MSSEFLGLESPFVPKTTACEHPDEPQNKSEAAGAEGTSKHKSSQNKPTDASTQQKAVDKHKTGEQDGTKAKEDLVEEKAAGGKAPQEPKLIQSHEFEGFVPVW